LGDGVQKYEGPAEYGQAYRVGQLGSQKQKRLSTELNGLLGLLMGAIII
jgi:hypothetical protein